MQKVEINHQSPTFPKNYDRNPNIRPSSLLINKNQHQPVTWTLDPIKTT